MSSPFYFSPEQIQNYEYFNKNVMPRKIREPDYVASIRNYFKDDDSEIARYGSWLQTRNIQEVQHRFREKSPLSYTYALLEGLKEHPTDQELDTFDQDFFSNPRHPMIPLGMRNDHHYRIGINPEALEKNFGRERAILAQVELSEDTRSRCIGAGLFALYSTVKERYSSSSDSSEYESTGSSNSQRSSEHGALFPRVAMCVGDLYYRKANNSTADFEKTGFAVVMNLYDKGLWLVFTSMVQVDPEEDDGNIVWHRQTKGGLPGDYQHRPDFSVGKIKFRVPEGAEFDNYQASPLWQLFSNPADDREWTYAWQQRDMDMHYDYPSRNKDGTLVRPNEYGKLTKTDNEDARYQAQFDADDDFYD